MADFRFDPVSGSWVAIARGRRERPMEFSSSQKVQRQIPCPFCRGNEKETPPQITAFGADGNVLDVGASSGAWMARIVPNKYPSLVESAPAQGGGPYSSLERDGSQDIVIPSPQHKLSFSELTPEEAELAIRACQHRNRELLVGSSIKHVMIFLNCGLEAGASLGHIHLQIMASPLVSSHIADREALHQRHLEEQGLPLLRAVLDWEIDQQVRVIEETKDFIVFCPYASRHAFQIWIVPRQRPSRFVDLPSESLAELGRLMKKHVNCLETVLSNPSYNILFHQPSVDAPESAGWYVELFPRLTRTAGYELGTDIWVNPVAPEMAARRIRATFQP